MSEMVRPMDVRELVNVWISLLRKEKGRYQVVQRERLSIKDSLTSLKRVLKLGEQSCFFSLIPKREEIGERGRRRIHAVMILISLLELARLKKIKLFQNERYGDIFIDVQESLADFNVNLADGMEPTTETA